MDLFQRIMMQGIRPLQEMGVDDSELIIAFSPLVERMLVQTHLDDVFSRHSMTGFDRNTPLTGVVRLFNCECNRQWPYNEVVVYHPKHACYYPDKFIKVLKIENLPQYVAS